MNMYQVSQPAFVPPRCPPVHSAFGEQVAMAAVDSGANTLFSLYTQAGYSSRLINDGFDGH